MTASAESPREHDDACPFCQIATGRDPALVVMRWPHLIAFVPQRPATVGHTLIVPVDHVPTIWDLDLSTAKELAVRAVELADVMRAVLPLDGLNLVQSNGEAATQSVMHLHLHLVPRYSDDAIGDIWPVGKPVSDDQSEAAAGQLREELMRRPH